jgi:hypothetical protein
MKDIFFLIFLWGLFGFVHLRLHNVYVNKSEDSENSKVTGNG